MTRPVQKIPWNEFNFEATRSRGPGGQNVNKTNSAMTLRWSLASTQAFSEEEKQKLLRRLENRLTLSGEILIRSETHRDQEQNKKACLNKLDELLERAFFEPKVRRKTKPTRSAKRKRVDEKKQRAEVKQNRQRVRGAE